MTSSFDLVIRGGEVADGQTIGAFKGVEDGDDLRFSQITQSSEKHNEISLI